MNNRLDKKMHDAIEKAFRKADTDGDGRLSIDEIIFICKVWSLTLTPVTGLRHSNNKWSSCKIFMLLLYFMMSSLYSFNRLTIRFHTGQQYRNIWAGYPKSIRCVWSWQVRRPGPLRVQPAPHWAGVRAGTQTRQKQTKEVKNTKYSGFLLDLDEIFRQMQGPIGEPKPVSEMESSEIAFSLLDKDKDGYVTSNEMKKLSKTLTDDQVTKESTMNYNVSCFKC